MIWQSLRKGLLLGLLGLNSCDFKEEINNQQLHDKVLACAAGFSDHVQANLHAASKLTNFSGDVSSVFKTTSQAIIFSNIPPSKRLKAYEDYIKCIESKDF